jgi:aminoglycoside 6-adenylyltransferase
MTAADFFPEFQRQFLAWVGALASVRLVLLVGSRARQVHPADEYADLDLELFGDDIDEAAVSGWLRAYAPTWAVLERSEHHTREWLTLYAGGYKVDVSISPLGEIETLIRERRLWGSQRRGYRVLLDRDSYAARLPEPSPHSVLHAPAPDEAAFVAIVEEFWYGAVYMAKQIKRGKLWKAKWADQMQQRALLTMLEWHAQAMHPEGIDTWHNGDYLRDWVDDATWQRIHDVFAHFDQADSHRALAASIRLFDDLARETAALRRYGYPAALAQEVMGYCTALLK